MSPHVNKLTSLFAADLVAAWAEIGSGVEKNANNPHFGNSYADLEAVIAKCKPILARNNLALLQVPGAIDGDKISVINLLVHTSGETLSFTTEMPMAGKAGAQPAGSATTYAKRYAMKSLFGLADVDDDGAAASTPVPPKAPEKKPSQPTAARSAKPPAEPTLEVGDDWTMNLLGAIDECASVFDLKPLARKVNAMPKGSAARRVCKVAFEERMAKLTP